MFILCQNCHRLYDVPSAFIKHSRQSFKCSGCGAVFTSHLLNEQAEADEMPPPAAEFSPEQPAQPDVLDEAVRQEAQTVPEDEARPRFDLSFLSEQTDNPLETPLVSEEEDVFAPQEKPLQRVSVQWGVWAFLLFLILSGVFVWSGRYVLSRHFAPLASFYEKMGVDAKPLGVGLDFKETYFDIVQEDGLPTLLVKGTVVNVSDSDKEVPFLYFTLLNETGEVIQDQTVSALKETIASGEILPFETKIKPVKMETRQVDLTFRKAL